MAVATTSKCVGLTSLSPSRATLGELEVRRGASLAPTSTAEPLKVMSSVYAGLSPPSIGEGKSNPALEQARPNRPIQRRIPVVDLEGKALMPCTAVRARLLIKKGKAKPKWNKLGIFYIQLKYPVEPINQPIALGVDPGSKFEGISIVGIRDTILNVMSETVDWVKGNLEQRRRMRRARRYRKIRHRAERFNNRCRPEWWVPPSTKAGWDAKLRIIRQLKKIVPILHVAFEEDKAETQKGNKKWNLNFSPIQNGRSHFVKELIRLGFKAILIPSITVVALRWKYSLEKSAGKAERSFHSHCVDSWVMASGITGAKKPTDTSIYYAVPLRFHRRQLHRLQPEKGGVRKPYGGTLSLGLKRGTLVKHIKYGLCYISGTLKGRLSLHSIKTGKRLTQNAKKEDFKILTKIPFRTQFLLPLKGVGFLG